MMSHYPAFRGSKTDDHLKKMFPDSRIPKNVQWGKTKCSYQTCFGISPYFHDVLTSQFRQNDVRYIISFNESINIILQIKQMDLVVCFWDKMENKICSRYFDSNFLGNATTQKLLEDLKSSLGQWNGAAFIQLSMNGPLTNWKLCDKFTKDRSISDLNIQELISGGLRWFTCCSWNLKTTKGVYINCTWHAASTQSNTLT